VVGTLWSFEMSQLGQTLPTFSTPVPTIVRFAPKATKMLRRGE
jgi:hypothetical protein